ncbi:MAG: hypothetical protein ACRD3N_10910 [Terracidiphilus sp.]
MSPPAREAVRRHGGRKDAIVNPVRGVVMLLAAGVALWRGWQIHRGPYALLAYGLAALALGLGVWHLKQKPPAPRPPKL